MHYDMHQYQHIDMSIYAQLQAKPITIWSVKASQILDYVNDNNLLNLKYR